MNQISHGEKTRWRDSSSPWFDRALVAKAVASGEANVVIHGIRFTIERGHYFTGPVSGKQVECALLRREDGGFAPRGYVPIRELQLGLMTG